ncbi:MAG: hypothetical protein ABWX84_10170 [Nocardioides sp.]
MHHTVDHPSSGSVVRLARGDTLELLLWQRSTRYHWQVAMAPYGMDLLEDAPRPGTSGTDATRRLMFRAMRNGGGILRLERNHPYEESPEHLDLLVAVGA